MKYVMLRCVWLCSAAVIGSTGPAGLCSTASAGEPVIHTVIVQDFAFAPKHIVVSRGDVIRWTWQSGVHTVTSGVGCTAEGELFNQLVWINSPLFEWTVPESIEPGVIPYICLPHCSHPMDGTITVVDGKEPPVPGDLNDDSVVDVLDLLILLSAWGPCKDVEDCPADFDGNHAVDTLDLLFLLSNWS
jgi:plastocyanin